MAKNKLSKDLLFAFEDTSKFEEFSQLMIDAAKGAVQQYSKEEADQVIREKMFEILGIDEKSSRKEIRRAIDKHKTEVFEVIEETIENMLVSGWGQNPFFNEFVEVRNLADGDTNQFYTPVDTILTVSELSGNHHDMIRQKLGMGSTFSVKTSWYGVNFGSLAQKCA